MALQIPHAGLQLEEDFSEANAHLPTQSFILDLNDSVIDGMIQAANQGQEIRLSLGNKPTFSYGTSSHRIEPAFEDETDDIELFLTDPTKFSARAERLPQLAMSLFRKPELGYTYPYYKTNSDEEDEDDGEFYETASSPEADESDLPLQHSQPPHQSDIGLDTDIAALRDSMMQREAEKHEKSTRVIEGSAHTTNAKPNTTKRTAGSLQRALSGRRSPFGRTSLSPSPALSAVGSPSLTPADASSQQAADKARSSRSPIIHELAFKEQSYDNLWNKYPGSSEAEFRSALDKVADLDEETNNYVLRKKYWRELDVWRHDYASDEERQRAVDNAIRQFDKMRLSTAEPEWEKLLPYDKRGQGVILSKVQVSIAKGTVAPKIRVQKPDDSTADPNANDSGENGSGSGSNRTDEEGGESEPSRQGAHGTKKKMSAREAQEKRLLSTKKRSAPTSAPSAATASSSSSSSTKVSPVKSLGATAAAATTAAARANNANSASQTKFKSSEFVTDSDSESESESVPLAASSVHQSKLSASTVKSSSSASAARAAAANKGIPASIIKERLVQREREAGERSTPPAPPAAPVRKVRPSPVKEAVKPQSNTKPLPKKRIRDSEDDDDSSSGSSSGTPLSKRIKPTKAAVKAPSTLRDSRNKYDIQPTSSSRLPPPSSQRPRASNTSPNGSSSSSNGNSNSNSNNNNNNNNSSSSSSSSSSNGNHAHGITNGTGSSKLKHNNARDNHNHNHTISPTKSSPLASSPPTNASELDLSSEESVPPIGSSNTARKRKMVEASSNAYSGSKAKKHARPLPDDLVAKAQRFKTLYEKYAALYKDIASRNNPPKERVNDLLKMHRKLEALKKDINEEVTMCD